MSLSAVGNYFRALREAQPGLTQARLGKLVGVTDIAIGKIERGLSEPKSGLLARLVRVLRANPADVIDLLSNP
ncbi:helix-turn-helix transcriptional regulator, partial [Streptomyces sp. CHA16]|uniref:helix-turn-helix domain-containing protein n=1 Tax=Streptomyces sp. CHA16 TaxID=2841667 RepID=UPI002095D5AD